MSKPASALRPGETLFWPWALWLLPLVPLAILLLSALLPQQRIVFMPVGEGTLLSEPFRLDAGPLGSPFLAVEARIPPDTNVGYQLELLDPAGQVVLDLSREGWRETGTWSEDGESGTYDESETGVPLLLRPSADGLHRLRLRLQELSGSDGRPRTDPVAFEARLAPHRVNAPLLALTSAVGLVSSGCAWLALYGPIRRRHRLRSEEPRLGLRADLGPGLVRLTLRARYEPDGGGLPAQVTLCLRIRDGMGRTRLRREQPLTLRHSSVNGNDVLTGQLVLHLRLPERCSLGLQVDVPQGVGAYADALAQLALTVEDGVRIPRTTMVLDPWNAP